MFTQEINTIANKVNVGERLSPDEGLYLLNTEHSDAVEQLADTVREKRVGNVVTFTSTLFVHPTNLCEHSCPMCSFYAKPGWEKAWFLTPEQIDDKVRQHHARGINEIHVVGGLWKDCNLDYYHDLFTRIKNIDPQLHIKALSAVEYHFLAKLHSIGVDEVLAKMMSWGLDSLPGGGAEILVEGIRKRIAPQKISSDEYLAVHKIAHQQGLPSNVTMLFGHVEEHEDIITHLCKVRELQDETGGFQTFVPLKYSDENNTLGTRKKIIKPKNLRRIYAVSRLMLDNITNIKVLWNYIGIEEAQQVLNCGGNDLGSTAVEEKVIEMAGGTNFKMTTEMMVTLIEEIRREARKSAGK